jgi:hypothetical protein
VDGLLSFWLLSTVFAVVGSALRGLIRPLSWATLAIATLFIAPSKMTETVNAIRAGEVSLSLPSLPPPPPVPPAVNSTPTSSIEPVPLDPNAVPSTRIVTTPSPTPAIADKGWDRIVDLTAPSALPAASEPDRPANPVTTSPAAANAPNNPPVPALW